MNDLPVFPGSRAARERAASAADGSLTLQRCRDCGLLQYPCREVCAGCLSGNMEWSRVDAAGTVIASARLHASLHPYFRERTGRAICSVALDAGPRVIAHDADGSLAGGDRVEVTDHVVDGSTDSGHCVLIARRRD